ncbi:hypothetical protein CPB83DRAFT_899996 [Crepidotus variabilis]|uniref:Uncharacterized protein n=1 Tax=Crepidotus variabilis TaxID=179855 RepID=A0A9P6JI53_9AGAR|nr:hypothetical protein CPB83DRAFT_899996 [Crepidotus variabilis]
MPPKKSTSSKAREIRMRNMELLTPPPVSVPTSGTKAQRTSLHLIQSSNLTSTAMLLGHFPNDYSRAKSPGSQVSASSNVPYSAHTRLKVAEERQAKLLSQSQPCREFLTKPSLYNLDRFFEPILTEVSPAVLLNAFDALVQNLYGESTRRSVAVSTKISNAAVVAATQSRGESREVLASKARVSKENCSEDI